MGNTAVKIRGALPHQLATIKAFHEDGYDTVIKNGGRNVGKTLDGVLATTDFIGRFVAEHKRPPVCAFVVPTGDEQKKLMNVYIGPDGWEYDPTRPQAFFPWRFFLPGTWHRDPRAPFYQCDNGTIINFFTEHAMVRMTGVHYNWIWADEVGVYRDEAIDTLFENQGTEENCLLLMTSTPYRERVNGAYRNLVRNPPETVKVLEAPSSENIHKYTPERLQRLRQKYEALGKRHIFEMKYLGKFTRPEGLVYDVADVRRIDVLPQDWYPTSFTAGMDFGSGGSGDPFAFVLAGADREGNPVVLDEVYITRDTTVGDCIPHIKSCMRRNGIESFTNVLIYADPSRKDSILECRRAGLAIKEANNSILDGVDMGRSLVNRALFLRPNLSNFLNEADGLTWAPSGKPVDKDNHACDAYRYMSWSPLLRFSPLASGPKIETFGSFSSDQYGDM